MILSDHTTYQISIGAIAITLLSALIGGHLTASYLIYTPSNIVMEAFIKIVLGLVILNIVYFILCVFCMLATMPKKSLLLKASLFMLINIPIAVIYLFIVLGGIL